MLTHDSLATDILDKLMLSQQFKGSKIGEIAKT
jgi:hypothetical protein